VSYEGVKGGALYVRGARGKRCTYRAGLFQSQRHSVAFWSCSHRHLSRKAALWCAKRELDRRLSHYP
jgi:hypothetical protein